MASEKEWKKREMIVMSAAAGKTYICFYSNKCKFCEYFLRELANIAPLKTQFHFVCVDPSSQRPVIPASITQVPAVIQRGEQVPMLGNDAINWLATMKLQFEAPTGSTKPAGMPEEPEAYFAYDMGGRYSSAFTYIDNHGQELGGTTGNFEYLGGGASMATTAAGASLGSQPVGGGKVSAKEKMFNKQMEEYMSQREMGMPKPPQRL
jgi:hypothetical protein